MADDGATGDRPDGEAPEEDETSFDDSAAYLKDFPVHLEEHAEHDTPPPPPPPDPRLNLHRLDVVLMIAITLLTGMVHFARLATPDRVLPDSDEQCRKFPRINAPCREQIPLDEWHYLPDARDVILYGTESDRRVPPDDGAFVVHPPVGKWFIALGIRWFGDNGFGWRFSGALLGSVAVALMYLLARRLWGSPVLAAVAASLLGIEGLWFVMSRIAMLDIYMAFFVLLGIWLLIEDRYRTLTEHRGFRWWRIGAGVAFGLAVACKWGAIPFWAMAVALAVAWETRAAYTAAFTTTEEESPARKRPRVAPRILRMTGALVLLPVLIYVATFAPWFTNDHRYHPPRCEKLEASWFSGRTVTQALTGWVRHTGTFGKWVCYQREMLDFHLNLEKFTPAESTTSAAPQPVNGSTTPAASPTTDQVKRKPAHPYFGETWSWPWMGRPVAHYYETRTVGSEERILHILGLPNPAIWWPAFALGIPLCIWWALRRRDRIASLLIAFIAAGWLPYLYADAKERPAFLFYALPMVPFLILGLVHVIARAVERYPPAVMACFVYVGVAALAFAFFYPVLSAYPLDRDGVFGWNNRMWFYSPHLQIFGRYLIPGDCTAVDVIKRFCWI